MAKGQSTAMAVRLTGVGRGRTPVTVALVLHGNRWIREQANIRGWRLINLNYTGWPKGFTPHGALIEALPDHELVMKLRKYGCPIVRIGRLPHPEDHLVPVVLPDHIAEGRLAAEHFHKRGFRHVGFFGHDPWSDAKLLYEGFRDRAASLGIQCHLQRFRSRQYRRNAHQKKNTFLSWLEGVPKPFGLLAPGDDLAARYCTWAGSLGLAIPDDVAVLSNGNNLDICESVLPTISSIDSSFAKRSEAACELIAALMTGGARPTTPILIPPDGIAERQSTDVLATSDPIVAAALRFMWDHLAHDLSIEDVAEQIRLSSRQLERLFRQALGRTVNQEMRRKRLEEGKRLLRMTDDTIADITPQIGFHSTAYFHKIFQQSFGITPLKYRREAAP